MKYSGWILGLFFLGSFSAFSQEKFTEHTVAKGETISKIAQQYNVKSSDIYDLNPESIKGIKYKSVLLIPNKKNKTAAPTKVIVNTYTKIHTAFPKETLYSIAKKYSVSIDELYAVNPKLKSTGLKNGQKILIPINEENNPAALSQEAVARAEVLPVDKLVSKENTPLKTAATIVREIQPSETKYAIAKEYGITVAAIDKANPILETEALKIGQKIIIPINETSNNVVAVVPEVTKKEAPQLVVIPKETQINETHKSVSTPVVVTAAVAKEVPDNTVSREVLAKETKYGIAKEFGITVKELEKQNPNVVKGLPVGYVLNITSKKQIVPSAASEAVVVNEIKESQEAKHARNSKDEEFLNQLVSTASENLGTRYRYGGTTKNGIDCSALMCNTFSSFDIQLPRTSIEQSQYGVVVNSDEAQKGDLIFFKTSRRNRINHVGMVVDVSGGDIKFIHASVSEGVIISSVKEKYYSKKVTQINRVL